MSAIVSGDINLFNNNLPDTRNRFRRLEELSQRLEAIEKRCPQLFVKDAYRFPPLDTLGRWPKESRN